MMTIPSANPGDTGQRNHQDPLQQGGMSGGSGTTDRDHGGQGSHQPAGDGSTSSGGGTEERRRFSRRRDDPRP
jgi:hypothetical protein